MILGLQKVRGKPVSLKVRKIITLSKANTNGLNAGILFQQEKNIADQVDDFIRTIQCFKNSAG